MKSKLRQSAAWMSLIISLILVLFGFGLLLKTSLSPVLAIAVVVIGCVNGLTARLVLQDSRAGWAFALSLNGTLAMCLLFGAPKIRDAADIGLLAALVPCLVFCALTTLYAIHSDADT